MDKAVEDDSNETSNASDDVPNTITKKNKKSTKVDIVLKSTGNAPIMKKKKWAVEGDKPLGWIMEFIKRYLRLQPSESMYLYVNQTFAPSPDQIVKNLHDCYSAEGILILHYCKTQAWG